MHRITVPGLVLIFSFFLTAQQADELALTDAHLLSEIRDHNELMRNLEYFFGRDWS